MKVPKGLVGEVVVCQWKDITGDSSWQPASKALKQDTVDCWTVGLLIKVTQRQIVMAASASKIDGETHYGDVTTIPCSNVEAVEKVDTLEGWGL